MNFIDKIEIRKAEDGQFYVVLISDNNEDLFTSETYPEKEIADKTAAKVQADIPYAEIIDWTTEEKPTQEEEVVSEENASPS